MDPAILHLVGLRDIPADARAGGNVLGQVHCSDRQKHDPLHQGMWGRTLVVCSSLPCRMGGGWPPCLSRMRYSLFAFVPFLRFGLSG